MFKKSFYEAFPNMKKESFEILRIIEGSIIIEFRIHPTSNSNRNSLSEITSDEILLKLQKQLEDPNSLLRRGDFGKYAEVASIEYKFQSRQDAYGEIDILDSLTNWLPDFLKESLPKEALVTIMAFILFLFLIFLFSLFCSCYRCLKKKKKSNGNRQSRYEEVKKKK